MEADNPNDFNQRLNQWIASQGFWFHLRHSMSSGGDWSSTVFHLLRMLARVGLLLLVVALGFTYYLFKRAGTESFRDGVRSGLEQAFHASGARLSGFKRSQGEGMIRRLGLSGTEDSFFQSLEAGNVVFKMGLLDGLGRGWDAGVVRMNWLDTELRAGVRSEESATKAAASLFASDPDFLVKGVDVADVRLSWGYFQRAYGGISGSRMLAIRAGDSWRLQFRGGYFTQNWIRRFEIEELTVICRPDGIVVDSGVLKAGEGTVTFQEVRVGGSWEMPELSGSLVFDRIPLQAVLPSNVGKLIEGSFSGEFEIGGSTNSSEGVTFKGSANLDGANMISLRDNLHLLESLDVVDVFNSYKRVDFDEGRFDISTSSGELLVSGLELKARDLMEIYGRFTVRRPDEEELEGFLGGGVNESIYGGGAAAGRDGDLRLSLKMAAEAAKADPENEGKGDEADSESQGFFNDIAQQRRLRREAMDRARDLFVFGGGVQILIRGDAFERARELRELHPVDPGSGKIPIDVPLEGTLDGLTLDLAEEILNRGALD